MLPSRSFQFLSALFIALLLLSNIIAVKIGNFYGLFLPVAVIIFPVTYIIGDVLTEVYGFAAMRRVIWLGFVTNLVSAVVILIAQKTPAAPFYTGQDSFVSILGAAPRIVISSLVAYLFGSFLNSYVLARLKVKTDGALFWLRTILSTIIGEGADSLLFISIAFYGVFPNQNLLTLIVTQWLFKTAFEAVVTPLTYVISRRLKRIDRIDHFDRGTNFSPLQF